MLPSAFVSVGLATSLVMMMWWTCQTSCFWILEGRSVFGYLKFGFRDHSGDLSDDELAVIPYNGYTAGYPSKLVLWNALGLAPSIKVVLCSFWPSSPLRRTGLPHLKILFFCFV